MTDAFAPLKRTLGLHWGSQIGAVVFAAIFGGILLRLCWVFGGANDVMVAQNVLLCLVGSLLGWALGMFFSPFDREDSIRLEYLGKTIAAFASGYVLSKLEPIIGAATKHVAEQPTTVQWNLVGLFASAFLLTAIVVFVTRSYALKELLTEAENPAADSMRPAKSC